MARRFASCCRSSHKRNSKHFDRLNRAAAISSHDEILQIENPSWADSLVWAEHHCSRADDDQRCGGDVSVSDLLQVVRRIREGRSLRAIQLSIHRFRRRPETNSGPDGGLRRVGRPDERRQSVESAWENFAYPDGSRRGRYDLQCSWQSRLETRWRDNRRYFSRQNQEME